MPLANIGLMLLAAGASTRMGTPKQLLPYKGSSLVAHATEVALASVCQPVVVVLGAYAEQIKPELNDFTVKVIENSQWSKGMGASIRSGIKALLQARPNLDAVVITLADQPLITPQIINKIVAISHKTGQPIVASQYTKTVGVPALFSHTLFAELANLEGSAGAKKLIYKHTQLVQTLPISEAAVDIDTPADYKNLPFFTSAQ